MSEDDQGPRALYRRLVLSWWDLWYADQLAELLQEYQQRDAAEIRRIAATVAAVVSYARPFSSNLPTDDTARTIPNSYLEILDERERKLHERLIQIRNKEFAHTDAEVQDLSVKIEEHRGEKTGVPVGRDPMTPFGPKKTEFFRQVISKLIRKVDRETENLLDQFEVGEEF